jgi:hypothetical protein
VGAIIGRQGATIKKVEQATGAHIRCVSARGASEGVFSIRGNQKSIASAEANIADLVAAEEAAAERAREELKQDIKDRASRQGGFPGGWPNLFGAPLHQEPPVAAAAALKKATDAASLFTSAHPPIKAIKGVLVLTNGASAANDARLGPEREDWLRFARDWVLGENLVNWPRGELDAFFDALVPGVRHLASGFRMSEVELRRRIRQEAAAWLEAARGPGI